MASADENKIRQLAYEQYIDDSYHRFGWITTIVGIAELLLMILDFQSGFFRANRLNYLNLAAEIMLIAVSVACSVFISVTQDNSKFLPCRVPIIIGYRIVVMIAILLFIFTDVYVRHKTLGAYIVFLFVLEITPAYKARTNWIQFSVFGIVLTTAHFLFVSKSPNTLFGTVFVFVAFAISTDYLRRNFIRHLENRFRATEANKRFQRLASQSIIALAGAVEAKDPYTKGHSQRVALYSKEIAARLGYSEGLCEDVYYIGLMHDIGKIGVSDRVITKAGSLTDEEYTDMKRHPIIGYEILKDVTELSSISEGARWHHERYDGRGYPDGLSGEQIPEIARIIAVADAYDAMTSNRSYRSIMAQKDVHSQIKQNAGKQFDPKMAQIMLDMMDADAHYKMHE